MYNIYFRNRVLTICNEESPLLNDNSTVLLHPSSKYKLSDIPVMMEKNLSFKHLVVSETNKHNQEELFREITSELRLIKAAGGVIRNNEDKYLMIFRRNVWDLPKGKQDDGEEILHTALREVKEEVGLNCTASSLLCITHHIYRLDKELVLKDTYWYSMDYSGSDNPVPQEEENITKCTWCSREDVAFNLRNSYGSIREVFTKAGIV